MGMIGQRITAHAQRHHDLLHRRIAGALANAIDGAFDLPRAALDPRERVGDRKAQIVMAMDGEDRLVRIRHSRPHGLE